MSEKEIVSKRILDCLDMCKVQKEEKYFEIAKERIEKAENERT